MTKPVAVKILYGNQSKDFTFQADSNIRKVLEEAIVAFNLPPPIENYYLFDMVEGFARAHPQPLSNLSGSLENYGIHDKATFVMAHIHLVAIKKRSES